MTDSGNTTQNVREIEQIKRENNNIVQNLRELEKQESQIYGRKKEYIGQMAENYVRLRELGEYKLPLDHICATICSRLTEEGMIATESYARRILPDKYKQAEFMNTSANTSNYDFQFSTANIPSVATNATDNFWSNAPTYSVNFDPTPLPPLPKQDKSMDEMNRDELRDATEQRLKIAKQMKEQLRGLEHGNELYVARCARENVALDPEVFKVKEPSETTLVNESGETQLYTALKYYSALIDKAAEKVYKLKPKDAEAKKWAKAVMFMAELWKPWADEKYRKDSISWMLVQMDNLAHGKHAAATMHSTLTTDGIKRALTREQVGDKYEAVLQQAVKLTTAYGDMIAMHRWHSQVAELGIADRAVRMHGKLSEKS